MTQGPITVQPYRELSWTYGSDLRDRAMILEALVLLKVWDRVSPMIQSISATMTQSTWLSTQETSYALLALARAAGDGKKEPIAFSFTWNGGKEESVNATTAIVQRPLTVGDKASLVVRNTGGSVLYPRLILSGLPAVGQETAASNGLALVVEYLTPDDKAMDPARLEQGTDFKARVKLTNSGVRGDLQEIALSHLVASGWEIHNDRMSTAQIRQTTAFDYQDIRDDRVYTYLDLKAGETKTIELRLNASYLGRYYLPLLSAEAMYDATLNARAKGRWVEVVEPGRE
jgi:alpha-2-macroglobulin